MFKYTSLDANKQFNLVTDFNSANFPWVKSEISADFKAWHIATGVSCAITFAGIITLLAFATISSLVGVYLSASVGENLGLIGGLTTLVAVIFSGIVSLTCIIGSVFRYLITQQNNYNNLSNGMKQIVFERHVEKLVARAAKSDQLTTNEINITKQMITQLGSHVDTTGL